MSEKRVKTASNSERWAILFYSDTTNDYSASFSPFGVLEINLLLNYLLIT